MLSDEEKQAIEYLKRHIIPCYGRKGTIEFMLNDTLLNLIEKQQKEIEELKAELEDWKFTKKYVEDNYVSKDKTKAKIEEYKNKIKKIRNKKLINEPEDTINITRYVHLED